MKGIKRIIALLLTAVMTMTMSVTAFAAGTGNSLTVNVKDGQDLKGQTINLYKLFDVTTSQSGETKNYAYTVNNTYKEKLATTLSIADTSKNEEFVKKVGALKDTKGAVQKFANDFTAATLTSNLEATATSNKITESKTAFEFNKLKPGYYLVYVTGGKEIQSSLVTVEEGKTNTINLKTEAPSITKRAEQDTVSIGQVVKYTVTGSVPDTTGYEQYVYKIQDTLSKGLDFVNDKNGTATSEGKVNVTVAFKEAGVTAGGTTPTTATLDTTNKTMSLDLSVWVRANQTNKGKEFTVTYYAKVNKEAVVTEKNSATLEYGNNPGDTTTTKPSEVKTPTYALDINKTKAGTDARLAGAKFKLYKDSTNSEANVVKVEGTNGNYVVDPTSDNTVFESVASIDDKNYNLHVNGLAAGTYYLVETEAPAGFNKLTDPIKVNIAKSATGDVNDWTLSKNDDKEDDKIIDVENSTGSILPSTGGMGTIAFTVVATLLVLGVAVSFIHDRKREN